MQFIFTDMLLIPQLLFLLAVVSEKKESALKKNKGRNGEVSVTPVSRSFPAAPHTAAPSSPVRLILPEDFNLLPRVPSHNFFKSTFYETAIPFHRGPCTVNPICKASYAVTLTWQKCQSAGLCFALSCIIACWSILLDTRVPTRVHQESCSGYCRGISVVGMGDKSSSATQTAADTQYESIISQPSLLK